MHMLKTIRLVFLGPLNVTNSVTNSFCSSSVIVFAECCQSVQRICKCSRLEDDPDFEGDSAGKA